jgi:hypothetical protein
MGWFRLAPSSDQGSLWELGARGCHNQPGCIPSHLTRIDINLRNNSWLDAGNGYELAGAQLRSLVRQLQLSGVQAFSLSVQTEGPTKIKAGDPNLKALFGACDEFRVQSLKEVRLELDLEIQGQSDDIDSPVSLSADASRMKRLKSLARVSSPASPANVGRARQSHAWTSVFTSKSVPPTTAALKTGRTR